MMVQQTPASLAFSNSLVHGEHGYDRPEGPVTLYENGCRRLFFDLEVRADVEDTVIDVLDVPRNPQDTVRVDAS